LRVVKHNLKGLCCHHIGISNFRNTGKFFWFPYDLSQCPNTVVQLLKTGCRFSAVVIFTVQKVFILSIEWFWCSFNLRVWMTTVCIVEVKELKSLQIWGDSDS